MKLHKTSFTLFFVFVASFSHAEPWQKVLLTASNDTKIISIPEGKIIEFHDFFDSSNFLTTLDFGGGVVITSNYRSTDQFASDPLLIGKEKSYVGPVTVTLTFTGSPDSGDYLLTWYRSVENPDDLATNPQGTVVIPEDLEGPISIALESSTDLENWTAANPGTYGTSSQRRFFRLRAFKE